MRAYTTQELIAAVRYHALTHYSRTSVWSEVVELWEDFDISARLENVRTLRGAVLAVERHLLSRLAAERQNYASERYENGKAKRSKRQEQTYPYGVVTSEELDDLPVLDKDY